MFWFFKNYGILGQNARNLKYISEFNNRFSKKLADSKIKTKEFLQSKGINVSGNIAIIKTHEELENFDLNSLPTPFVIKPNAGYGGKGIIIFDKKDAEGNFITNDNKVYTINSLKEHIKDILDGFYSLSGNRDKVIFEKKIILDQSIELLGKYGLPDIRVIVFNSIPVIAMLRVPTENSKGKANLHSGACGVGIDIASGKLTYITQFGKIIKSVPGIGDIRGIEIPKWEEILFLAVKVQQVTSIGYLGCDIVLDNELGPILLEMNVRPGLEVQIANKTPLLERLKKVENIKVKSIEKGVRLGRDLFGGDIEEEIKNISGKKVLGNREYIEIYYNEKIFKTICEIKISTNNCYINTSYLRDVLKIELDSLKNNQIKLKSNILGEKKNIRFFVKDLERFNIIIGREAMVGFLIDPFKYKDTDLPIDFSSNIIKKNLVILKRQEDVLLKLDREIVNIDKKLNILKIITPKNLESEKIKFIESKGEYIPQFEYNDFNLDLNLLFEKINKIEIPDVPLAGIYKRKKEEIIDKINFLKAFLVQDEEKMSFFVKKLFGDISQDNLNYALNEMEKKTDIREEQEFLTIDEIKKYVNKFNHIYGINVKVVSRNMGSRCAIKGDVLYVINSSKIGKREIRSIVAHEIESHYLRKINGKKIKFGIFSQGFAGYLETEEGIATYNQMRFLSKNDKKYYSVFESYFFINFALNNDYKTLLEEYKKFYKDDYSKIFNYMIRRLKRGIKDTSKNYIFSKDVVYLNGYLNIKDFVENGGDIKELYIGKIGLLDLKEIKNSEIIKTKVDDYKIPLFI